MGESKDRMPCMRVQEEGENMKMKTAAKGAFIFQISLLVGCIILHIFYKPVSQHPYAEKLIPAITNITLLTVTATLALSVFIVVIYFLKHYEIRIVKDKK